MQKTMHSHSWHRNIHRLVKFVGDLHVIGHITRNVLQLFL